MRSFINIKNRSNYFVPTITRKVVQVTNPSMYLATKQRIEGYETRLYYEYERTKAEGGFAQFVTLTYNDKSLPTFYGIPCLRNSDIRRLFHDCRFFKDLEKRQGYSFKYFVGAEFGEGGKSHDYEGVRGEGNNPHYHVVLFFTPIKDWKHRFDRRFKVPKEKVQACYSYQSANAILKFWQGSSKLRRNYNLGSVDFGSVHPFGLIQDFRGCSYVSKYCVKDVYFKRSEDFIRETISQNIQRYEEDPSYTLNEETGELTYIDDFIDNEIKRFRKEHSYRVLCSQGLGITAKDNIQNLMDPLVKVASKKGFRMRSLPLYIYRKVYYDIAKDPDGRYYYKLNALGKKYKLTRLSKDLESLVQTTQENVRKLVHSKTLREVYYSSEDSKGGPYYYHNLKLIHDLSTIDVTKDPNNLFIKYALYKKIYQNRCFRFTPFRDYPVIDVPKDYNTTLQDTHLLCFDSSSGVNPVLERDTFSYDNHPYFKYHCSLFSWFDDINSYFVVTTDRENKRKYEEYKQLKRIQNNLRYASS